MSRAFLESDTSTSDSTTVSWACEEDTDVDIEELIGAIHLYFFKGIYPDPVKATELESVLAHRFDNQAPSDGTMKNILAEMADGDVEMSHVPISLGGFFKDKPRYISSSPVTEEELEGYRYYLGEIGL